MPSQAEEIRDLLFNNWQYDSSTTDANFVRISKESQDTQNGNTFNMREIVYFYDRKQVEGNAQTKAITVEKINDELGENFDQFPAYSEKTDLYEITLYYRVNDVQQPNFSDALLDVENMATETVRILKTQYDPVSGTGPYFMASYQWLKFDMTEQAQPELIRRLYLRLTNLSGFNDDVFNGFDGVLIFDSTPPPTADNPPGADYTYVGAYNQTTLEGFEQIPYLTKDITNGRGVPYLSRGMFRGTFTANMYAQTSDLNGTTSDKLYEIYKTQNNSPIIGQQIEVTFLQINTNSKTPTPDSFELKTFIKVNRITMIDSDSALKQFVLEGQLTKPSVATVTVS